MKEQNKQYKKLLKSYKSKIDKLEIQLKEQKSASAKVEELRSKIHML